MKKFSKKNVSKDTVKFLHEKFSLSPLEASILSRRGITEGKDLLYFLEDDLRFTHQPFLLNGIEDAVERINQAKDEEEKILIFGDRDVDGITSTSILYNYLKKKGCDVSWKIPTGEESYGLTQEAVENFAKEYGTLIITVDCGISNYDEIEKANSLGIDVIVTDHHNPPEKIPNAAILIDPKLSDSNYPFKEISGAAVAFKLTEALRFSETDFYNQEFCFLNVEKKDSGYKVDCIKLKNLVQVSSFSQTFENFPVSFQNTKLYDYIKSELICVWSKKNVQENLKNLFGNNIDFNLYDVEPEITKTFPSLKNKTLSQLKNISKIAKYTSRELSEVEGLSNLFVTYIQKTYESKTKSASEKDLQLVSLAALADVMPLKNENRIFIKEGIKSMNSSFCEGLSELFAKLNLFGKPVNAQTLSWKINPAINACGRVGESYIAVKLFTEEDPKKREEYADQIVSYNEKRKENVSEAEFYISKDAEESIQTYKNNLCFVCDERINKGITGLLAGKFVSKFNVPSFVLSLNEEKTVYFGSLRTCRNFNATEFLSKFEPGFFIAYGGHDCAAGFSLEKEKISHFKEQLLSFSKEIQLSESEELALDAELPSEYITEELCTLIEKFEPYGQENAPLTFFSKNLPIIDAQIIGKTEPQHLKLTLDCGKFKFPAVFWKEASRLNRDFSVGQKINILYNIEKNTFNGISKPQIVIIDAEKSE